MVRPKPDLELFERIGYDPTLETRGLARLNEMNLVSCRKALGELVARLDLSRVDGDAKIVIQLLGDVLQKVNQRIHGHPGDEATYQSNRLLIIEAFARCRTSGVAREQFLPVLNRVLAPLQRGRRPRHTVAIRARGFIERNYHRRLSLSCVAERLAVSPSYLSRLFRSEMGITLTAYIQRLRIERARLLLAEGGRSMAEIAYAVGYQNYRNFYRNFVKYENASPRQIRSQLKRGE